MCHTPAPTHRPGRYLLQLDVKHGLRGVGQEFVHAAPLLPQHGLFGRRCEVQRREGVGAVVKLVVDSIAAQFLDDIHKQFPLSFVFFPLGDS